jgi:ABC-type branched-subunit amino acid transport system substrate-binding protein
LTATDTGVTPTTVTINNSADLTGPVPGLFQTAQDGVKAFVAYFNATGQTICGRRLALTNLDSQSSEAGDNQAASNACANAFAMVGGDSAFDQGGAPVVERCGIPDIRATVNSVQRGAVPNVVAASSDDLHWFEPSIASIFAQKFGDKVTQHAAIAYINVGVGQQQAARYKAGFESQGWKVVDVIPIDVSDFSYDPFAQKMKGDGVDFVFFIAAEAQYARMAQSFQAQNFHPDVFLMNPNGYDSVYTQAAGPAGKGSYVYIDALPFTEAASNPELQLYLTWLNRVAPNAEPSWFGELAWSAARLFTTLAGQVGPDLTRKAFVTKLRQVSAWTSNGLTSPQPIGAKTTGSCWAILQWDGAAWNRASPAPYTCTPPAMKVSY